MARSGNGEVMDPSDALATTRRHFLSNPPLGLGALGLADILGAPASAAAPPLRPNAPAVSPAAHGLPGLPHFAPKVRRVIYLFQSGGPAHQDLFDYKPLLQEKNGEPLPEA